MFPFIRGHLNEQKGCDALTAMIGKRIRYFRNRCGMTQKQLGNLLGFSDKTADVRVAQYESCERNPKERLIEAMATVFHISPYALTVPNNVNVVSLMHTLFSLEDCYGIYVESTKNGVCLKVNNTANDSAERLYEMLSVWLKMKQKLETNEITKEAYDAWRYNFSGKEVENCQSS